MPIADEHVRQAEHNWSLHESLLTVDNGRFTDWVVTASFYSALHFVEALIFSIGKSSPHQVIPPKASIVSVKIQHSCDSKRFYETKSDHLARNLLLRDNDVYANIRDDYMTLYSMSRRSRYECHRISKQDAEAASKRLGKIKDQFSFILARIK